MLQDYCALDTLKLFELLKSFKKKMNRDEIFKASERYVDYFRSYIDLPERKFYRHGLLPNNILTDYPRRANAVYNNCSGCLKEFSKSFLDKVSDTSCFGYCDACSFIKLEEERS